MQLGRGKVGILREDGVLMLSMHLEDGSEPRSILEREDVPSGTSRRTIALLSCKHTDIDCISEITVELC